MKIFRTQVNIKLYAIIIAISFIPEILTAPMRGYLILPGCLTLVICAAMGFLMYLLITHRFLQKYQYQLKEHQIIVSIIIGLMILQGPIRISNFTSLLFSLPELFSRLLGVFAGFCFYKRASLIYRVNFSISLLVILFTIFYGYNFWMHKLDYGTFTGSVYYKGPNTVVLNDKDVKPIILNKGKFTVLDFWFVGCGSCMNEFPEFQKMYSQYKNDNNVQFYSVNQPFPDDANEDRFKILTDKGYNFPMAACPDRWLTKELKIAVYPTVVVLNPQGDVIYKGDIANLKSIIKPYIKQDNPNQANMQLSMLSSLHF